MQRISLIRVAIVTCLSLAWCGSYQPAQCQEKKTQQKKPSPGKPARPVPSNDDYKPGPDSQPQQGVPRGKIFSFKFEQSQVFPGTSRQISVYVPAQYKADKPACVYVALDGLGFSAPVVFDNLIHKGEMPVMIGVGVSPGAVASASPPANPRFNRSLEFDGLNGNLARLVLDEVLPEVEKQKTPDGLAIVLSKDPNDRCTGGGSTGGIAAFTLAWERPDAFRRVFTAIGTFVGMRGGDRYPVLVRKTEPKPLRIFMQDGSNDQWGGGPEVGDWWIGNQGLQRALEFAGYQVEHVWGEGIHSGRHATAIFPDAMRWLWKDWPQPIQAGTSQNHFLQEILASGEDWQALAKGHACGIELAANQQGELFFRDSTEKQGYKIAGDGRVTEALVPGVRGDALAFGPDGRMYRADAHQREILAYEATGKATTIAEGIRAGNLVVTHNGNLYASEPAQKAGEDSKIWLIRTSGEKQQIDRGLDHPSGIVLSPDGLWLAVAEEKTHWGYSYQVEPDGAVAAKQQFYWFHVPDTADGSGARAWCADRDGRLYSATRMGVEVFDRNGRVRAILPLPGGQVEGICFGGEKFDTLYVVCDGQLWARKMKVAGAPPWLAPIKLPNWGGG